MTTRNFRVSFQFIIGLLILGLGVLYMLQSFGVLYASDFTRYWPVLLVIYGISRMIQGDTAPQKAWGAFWAFVGTIWVLDKMYIIYFDFFDLWPLILVALGVSLIWGTSHRLWVSPRGGAVGDSSSTVNAFSFLGGFKRANDSQDFRGGEVTAVMGACEIDLRKASIREGEAVLTLVAIMGGIEVWVPEDWAVTLQGVPILGGYEDETHRPPAEVRKRLIIKGYSIMGGVEVKN